MEKNNNMSFENIPVDFKDLSDGDFLEYDAQQMTFVVKNISEKQVYDGGIYE